MKHLPRLAASGLLGLALTGSLLAATPVLSATAAPKAPAAFTDVNGDGKADIVSTFQAPLAEVAAADANEQEYTYRTPGSVTVIYGGTYKVSTVTQQQLGEAADPDLGWSGSFGASQAVADLNRDGYSDIIVGNPMENEGTGEVWVLWGSPTGISAAKATRLLTGEESGTQLGSSLAYVAKPSPALVVGDLTQDEGRLAVYPVKADGSLGAPKQITGLAPQSDEGFSYMLASSGDLLVVGEWDATINDMYAAGSVDIVRFLPGGTWVTKQITQDSAGVPDSVEEADQFGSSVSVLNGYIAIGIPGETGGTSGAVQPLQVSGTGSTITVKVLPIMTPKSMGLSKSNAGQFLGGAVEVYRVCNGKYGVLIQGIGDPGKTNNLVIRAPFKKSSACKAKVLARTAWGWDAVSVLRTSLTSTKAETAVVNTQPRQLRMFTNAKSTVTKTFTAAQVPEFNFLSGPTP